MRYVEAEVSSEEEDSDALQVAQDTSSDIDKAAPIPSSGKKPRKVLNEDEKMEYAHTKEDQTIPKSSRKKTARKDAKKKVKSNKKAGKKGEWVSRKVNILWKWNIINYR